MSDPNPIQAALIAAGLLSEVGAIAGADASHPDALLIDLMGKYAAERDTAHAMFQDTLALGQDHPDFRAAFRDFTRRQFHADTLEAAVARTPATTREAAAAKMVLSLEAIAPKTDGSGCIAEVYRLCASAMRDALNVGF